MPRWTLRRFSALDRIELKSGRASVGRSRGTVAAPPQAVSHRECQRPVRQIEPVSNRAIPRTESAMHILAANWNETGHALEDESTREVAPNGSLSRGVGPSSAWIETEVHRGPLGSDPQAPGVSTPLSQSEAG